MEPQITVADAMDKAEAAIREGKRVPLGWLLRELKAHMTAYQLGTALRHLTEAGRIRLVDGAYEIIPHDPEEQQHDQ